MVLIQMSPELGQASQGSQERLPRLTQEGLPARGNQTPLLLLLGTKAELQVENGATLVPPRHSNPTGTLDAYQLREYSPLSGIYGKS